MSRFCTTHRVPRAGVDPIDCEDDALALLSLVVHDPTRPEVLAILLDCERRGLTILDVTETTRADAVLDVADVIGQIALEHPELDGVIIASIRPDGGLEPGDLDRWSDANASLDDRGVELVEWFVIGGDVMCPRQMLGEPPRWDADRSGR